MFLDDKKASAIQKDNIIAFFACHLYYVTYVSNYFLSLQETITFFQRRCKQPNFLTMNSKKRNIETNKDSRKLYLTCNYSVIMFLMFHAVPPKYEYLGNTIQY